MSFGPGAEEGWAGRAMARFPDALCVVDARGEVLWAGGAVESVTGGPPESIVGRKVEDLLHPDDHSVGLAQFLLMLEGELPGTPPAAYFRVRANDGDWVPVSLAASALTADDGQPLILASIRRTPEKAAVEEVLEQLVSGAPRLEILKVVMRLWEPRAPLERVGLTVRTEDETISIAMDLPEELAGTLDLGEESPWARAHRQRATVKVSRLEELPPVLREAADREGLVGGWFVPISIPGSSAEGMLLAWTRPSSPLRIIEDSALVATTVRLVTLVMGWHEHLATLTAAAGTDHLTGAANRAAFVDALGASPAPAPRTLLYIDLDGFKPVNDQYGHLAGDEVLVEVACRLQGAVRSQDLVARLGGDEFAVLCHGLEAPDEAIAIAERIIAVLAAPIQLADDGVAVTIGASIGIAEATVERPSAATLLELADRALFEAKAAGRNRWHFAASAADYGDGAPTGPAS